MGFKPGNPLPAQALYRRCDPEQFAFKTTQSLEKFSKIPGQDRAVEAIHLATEIDIEGYNVFVLGRPGSGRHTFVREFLKGKAAEQPVPSDWCYVYNFDDPRQPLALKLPAGASKEFRVDIEHAIQDAQTVIPAAFESEDFQAQQEAITDEFKDRQEKEFQIIGKEAQKRSISVIQTPAGIAFLPMQDNEVIKSEDFDKLPEDQQKQIREDIDDLTARLQRLMRSIPKHAREMRRKIRQLEHDVASLAVTGPLDELKTKYQHISVVVEHLEKMQADIVENVGLFLGAAEGAGVPAQVKQAMHSREDSALRRYAISVLVDRSGCEGAPVVFEDKPSFSELIGKIEHEAEFGTLVTSFNLIRAGALHKANGGYLILDAAKVLAYPQAWEGLKRAIKSAELRIRSLGDDIGFVSTVSLEPQPIPLELKVVLIGERIHYYLLDRYDPEFSELFKIAADFEDQVPRSEENVEHRARLLATVIRQENLRHLDRAAVARLIEESARHAGDSERLSTDIRQAADLLREAHYWAGHNGKELIGVSDVQQAIDSQVRRASRYMDQMQTEIIRDTLVVETSGARIGQVNGLAVIQLGGFMFARPQRITATVSLGSGDVVDIEREVDLGGPLHSKGILILTGFLKSHYVKDQPLSMSASLVFEQSYGGVDGDSASAGEMCVLASALAEVPIKQSLAVTGSVDQYGRVQAIGGVNHKIEGFFDICEKRGLSGDQGVLIPAANVKHLMLREDVIEAVDSGKFHVYPVDHVDRCLELLTGLPSGKRDADGQFPEDSLNHKICARLTGLAEKRRAFAGAGLKQVDDTDAGKAS